MDHTSLTETKDKTYRLGLLVGKDTWTQTFFCNKVQRKGAQDPHIVGNVVKAIESMGHTKIGLVTDGEPTFVQLQAKMQARREPLITMPRNPPAYDTHSNGVAEKAVRKVKGNIRAVKLRFETKIQVSIDLREPIME